MPRFHYPTTLREDIRSCLKTAPKLAEYVDDLAKLADTHPHEVEYLCCMLAGHIRQKKMKAAGVKVAPDRCFKQLFGFRQNDVEIPCDDHAELLIDANGVVAYVSQPYHLDMARVLAFAERHSLHVSVWEPPGYYFPAHAIPIIWTKQGEFFDPFNAQGKPLG